MANGDIADNGTSRKLVVLCISLSAVLNGPTFYVLTEHAAEMSEIRDSISIRTADRYYRRDADAHEKLEEVKFNNVEFRFQRNEAMIAECKRRLDDLQ